MLAQLWSLLTHALINNTRTKNAIAFHLRAQPGVFIAIVAGIRVERSFYYVGRAGFRARFEARHRTARVSKRIFRVFFSILLEALT
jgi:hypothetical protein